MKINHNLSYILKSLLVLAVGAILFSNWYFISTVLLQDAMMGSGLFALAISGIVTILLSNKLFDFKKKWILSLVLTILSFFFGRVIEENNLTYKDSSFYLELQEEKQRKWEAKESKSKNEKAARDTIESKIYEDHILALITYLESQDRYEYVTAGQVSHDYVLIYPEDLNTIICPIKVKPFHQDAFLKYFVLTKDSQGSYEFFRWIFFDPKDFKNTAVCPNLIEQLNTIMDWNFSSRQIDDMDFWNKYVLAKENSQYKYLERVALNEK